MSLKDRLSAEWIPILERTPTNEYHTLVFTGGMPEPTKLCWYSLQHKTWYQVNYQGSFPEDAKLRPTKNHCWLEYKLKDKDGKWCDEK